ncbi:MAG: hypothetical protein V4525_11585 [Pseudomonadota bacterium]
MDSLNVQNHSVPNQKKSNKFTLWLIIGICVLPLLLSTLIWWMGWGPSSKTQGGELITAPIQLQHCIQVTNDKMLPEGYQHKWLLLWRENPNSVTTTDNRVYLTQQLRLMQGKNRDRIARVFVSEKAYTIPTNGNDTVLTLKEKWCSDAKLAPNSHIPYDQRVYVVDPIGNIMMVLDATNIPKNLHKDLTRLLSVSSIG